MKKALKIYWLLASLVVLLFTSAFTLLQPEDPSELTSVLIWLASVPGALLFAGAALAFILEKVPAWGAAVPTSWRPWLVLVATTGISYGAKALLGAESFIVIVGPVYSQLYAIVAAWVGSQFGYAVLKMADMRAERLK